MKNHTKSKMSRFTKEFNATQNVAHTVNVQNGWWDDRKAISTTLYAINGNLLDSYRSTEAIALLGLVDSEVAEAMEAVRKHSPKTWHDASTKDTLVREMGGAVVRLMDLAEYLGLPLGQAIEEEIKHNATRGYKHGGKSA